MNKEIHVLGYTKTNNLGDEIQSLGAINTLKRLGCKHAGFIDRDNPQAPQKGSKPVNLLVNGFIPDNSIEMKSSGINVIFNNFHLHTEYTGEDGDEDLLAKRIEHLRGHQPIGCRDRYTTKLLQDAGLDVFFNYCLTLMFDRRKKAPANGKVFLVDVSTHMYLPNSIKRLKPRHITHEGDTKYLPSAEKMQRAQALLDLYRDEARLVITNRLHCALPCVSMGVPVILFGVHDYHRLSLAEEFIPLHKIDARPYAKYVPGYRSGSLMEKANYHLRNNIKSVWGTYRKEIDWDPQPIDISATQEQILKTTKEQILRFT